jgi:hypothetical protein
MDEMRCTIESIRNFVIYMGGLMILISSCDLDGFEVQFIKKKKKKIFEGNLQI